jgi:uncharacterized protein YndB with AHSA1/START domain
MNETDNNVANASALEIVNTRVFNCRRELVWKAWTNREYLARWWGPKGFTSTFQEFEMTPGGAWRFIMHGPDGKDYQNEIMFIDILEPERIVFDHVSSPPFQVTATFAEQSSQTRIVFRMAFQCVDECARVKAFAVEANEQNFDRLEAELARMASVMEPSRENPK